MTDNKSKKNQEEALDYKIEIAKKLKNYREKKKYSLEKLAEKTKIPLHVLQQLEDGSDAFYKEKVFVYGFLKLLCKELKVPAKEFLDLCDSHFPQSNINLNSLQEFKSISSKKNKNFNLLPKVSNFKTLKILSISLVAFLLTSFFYTLYQDRKKEVASITPFEKKQATPKNPIKNKEEKSLATLKESEQKRSPEKSKDLSLTQKTSQTKCPDSPENQKEKPKCISLNVKVATRFATVIDKSPKEKKLYEPGVYHFYYRDALEFVFDDASQVELLKGEKNWGVLSQRKEKKRIKFSNREMEAPELNTEQKL